ncbi:MAG: hypothetical protein AAFN30_03710 [Actinomycetota bacterium]
MHHEPPIEQVRVRHDGRAVTPRPGDLLFGNRRCSVQALMNLAGDQWTHMALVIGDDDDPRTVELGPNGVFSRPVEAFVERYRLIGLSRPNLSDPCRRAVLTTGAVHLDMRELDYSWPHCALIGSTAMLRRLAPGPSEERVVETGLRAAQRLRALRGGNGHRRATCSSFMLDLFDAACDSCRPTVHWPARRRVLPWQPRPTVTDVVGLDGPPPATGRPPGARFAPAARTAGGAARTLVAPADVWVADGFALRAVIDDRRTTLLHDLTEGVPAVGIRPPCAARPAAPVRKEVSR